MDDIEEKRYDEIISKAEAVFVSRAVKVPIAFRLLLLHIYSEIMLEIPFTYDTVTEMIEEITRIGIYALCNSIV